MNPVLQNIGRYLPIINKVILFWENIIFIYLYSQKGERGESGSAGLYGLQGEKGEIGEAGFEGMPGIYY